jgi:hypothetical protein
MEKAKTRWFQMGFSLEQNQDRVNQAVRELDFFYY